MEINAIRDRRVHLIKKTCERAIDPLQSAGSTKKSG